MREITLRRYTNLAATLHLLRNRCLTLLSPSTWDDRNDAFFMSEYKKQKQALSVLALCFAEAKETYHHWRVFSHGTDGVCVEFDKNALLEAIRGQPHIQARKVSYMMIETAKDSGIAMVDLPFIKRLPYEGESEFRVIYVDEAAEYRSMPIPISLQSISRVTLSPWMPQPLADAVKQTLKQIKGCKNLRIYRSTLIENERWMKIANPILK